MKRTREENSSTISEIIIPKCLQNNVYRNILTEILSQFSPDHLVRLKNTHHTIAKQCFKNPILSERIHLAQTSLRCRINDEINCILTPTNELSEWFQNNKTTFRLRTNSWRDHFQIDYIYSYFYRADIMDVTKGLIFIHMIEETRLYEYDTNIRNLEFDHAEFDQNLDFEIKNNIITFTYLDNEYQFFSPIKTVWYDTISETFPNIDTSTGLFKTILDSERKIEEIKHKAIFEKERQE